MKKLTLAPAAIVLLVFTVAAFGQAPDAKAKADEILKKARAAIGNESKFKGLQALSAEGVAAQNTPQGRSENVLQIEMLTPDKVKLSTTMQFGTTIRGFDGTNFWTDFIPAVGVGGPGGGGFNRGVGGLGGPGGPGGANNPMMAYMQQQQRREMIQILLAWFLTPPASTGMQYAYVGEGPGPEGSKLDMVDAKTSDGLSTRLYFNKETYRLVGLSYKAKSLRRNFGGRGPGGQGGQGGQGDNRRPQTQAGAQGQTQPQAGGQGQQPQAGGQQGQRPAQAGAQGQAGGQGQAGAQGQAGGQGQAGAQGQAGGQGQAGAQGQGQRPQMTQEERDRRAKEMADAFNSAPDVDYRWGFDNYKSVGGLNLPHIITRYEAGTATEEWVISKYKVNPKLTADKFDKPKERAANNTSTTPPIRN